FLFDNGGYTTLDGPGTPTRINASGQIVGGYQGGPNKGHGFLLDQGSYTTLDAPRSSSPEADRSNNTRQIVGGYQDGSLIPHGFLLDHGTYTTLDVFQTTPQGINASGQIVGWYSGADGLQGFLLDNGRYRRLAPPGSIQGQAYGINTSGQ